MDHSTVVPRTYLAKLNNKCNCDGCVRKLKKLLQKMHGIDSAIIDATEAKVIISGTALPPHRIIHEFEKNNRKIERFWELDSPQNKNNNDSDKNDIKQIILKPNPVEEFDDQDHLVAQLKEFSKIQGLEEVEITYAKTVKGTFMGKKNVKPGYEFRGDARKKILTEDNVEPPPPQTRNFWPEPQPAPPWGTVAYGYPYPSTYNEEHSSSCGVM